MTETEKIASPHSLVRYLVEARKTAEQQLERIESLLSQREGITVGRRGDRVTVRLGDLHVFFRIGFTVMLHQHAFIEYGYVRAGDQSYEVKVGEWNCDDHRATYFVLEPTSHPELLNLALVQVVQAVGNLNARIVYGRVVEPGTDVPVRMSALPIPMTAND